MDDVAVIVNLIFEEDSRSGHGGTFLLKNQKVFEIFFSAKRNLSEFNYYSPHHLL